jgi:hypothetical protein
MDPSWLDDLTRFIGQRTRRRTVATGALGGLLATLVRVESPGRAARKKPKQAACKKPKRRCGKQCVNIRTSRKHCGKCNRKCKPTHVCRGRRCTPRPCGKGGPCRVFITSTTYSGNLGGVTGADDKCNERARAAKLPGTYKAWLADYFRSPLIDFTHSPGPYVLVNGMRVANNWNDLTGGWPEAGHRYVDVQIDVTEFGQTVASQSVWTGATAAGTWAGQDCSFWISSSGPPLSGTVGITSRTDVGWTNNGASSCNGVNRLYCFQQSGPGA